MVSGQHTGTVAHAGGLMLGEKGLGQEILRPKVWTTHSGTVAKGMLLRNDVRVSFLL